MDTKLNEALGNKDYSSEFEGAEFEDIMNHLDSWNDKTVNFYVYNANDLRFYKKKPVKVLASLPAKNGNFTRLDFEIETTLANGKVITNKNGGFMSDYTITKNVKTDFNGNIESGFIPGDQVVVSVVCKHDKSKKAESKLTVDYNFGANFLLYGRDWNRSAGENGNEVEIEIKQENHKVTGKPVLRVKLKSNAARAPLREFTVSPTETIYVKTKGGDDEVKHFNSGDGGDITVYKDPSVKSFRIKYDCNGGKPGGRFASSGRDG